MDSGAAYVFEEPGTGGWGAVVAPSARIIPIDPHPSSGFGVRVGVQADALDGDTIVITDHAHESHGVLSGAVYVVHEPAGGWSGDLTADVKLISSQVSEFDHFGRGVAIRDDRIIVGSAQDAPPHKERIGRAFVFERQSGNTWRETHWLQADLHDDGGMYGAYMGAGVAIEGDTALVGAHLDDNDAGPDAGTVLVYDLPPCYIDLYCFCESGPCGNSDSTAGCVSSDDRGALLYALSGSTSVASDDLTLEAAHLPPQKFGILFMGANQAHLPFGDGYMCVAGSVFRYSPPQNSGSAGQIVFGPGLTALSNGRIDAAETWRFQTWYRDPMGPCGGPFNLTNALTATFVP
jgi:hypothetical protein